MEIDNNQTENRTSNDVNQIELVNPSSIDIPEGKITKKHRKHVRFTPSQIDSESNSILKCKTKVISILAIVYSIIVIFVVSISIVRNVFNGDLTNEDLAKSFDNIATLAMIENSSSFDSIKSSNLSKT
jgi:hypothetical protein